MLKMPSSPRTISRSRDCVPRIADDNSRSVTFSGHSAHTRKSQPSSASAAPSMPLALLPGSGCFTYLETGSSDTRMLVQDKDKHVLILASASPRRQELLRGAG